MKVIHLDASGWRSPADFYAALLPQLGAPSWHGRNLDALYDSLSGGINQLEPPFTVELAHSSELSSDMGDFLAKVAAVFEDARREFGANVSINID
ncbi:MAG TPA: barstar family protein [Allosphingosinicella sp.]|jgi:RNAse (barnase) inhibitor barstar|nr:barstar family protein [Allosphingosinicella sp.]